jgi:hypothetical protein
LTRSTDILKWDHLIFALFNPVQDLHFFNNPKATAAILDVGHGHWT